MKKCFIFLFPLISEGKRFSQILLRLTEARQADHGTMSYNLRTGWIEKVLSASKAKGYWKVLKFSFRVGGGPNPKKSLFWRWEWRFLDRPRIKSDIGFDKMMMKYSDFVLCSGWQTGSLGAEGHANYNRRVRYLICSLYYILKNLLNFIYWILNKEVRYWPNSMVWTLEGPQGPLQPKLNMIHCIYCVLRKFYDNFVAFPCCWTVRRRLDSSKMKA